MAGVWRLYVRLVDAQGKAGGVCRYRGVLKAPSFARSLDVVWWEVECSCGVFSEWWRWRGSRFLTQLELTLHLYIDCPKFPRGFEVSGSRLLQRKGRARRPRSCATGLTCGMGGAKVWGADAGKARGACDAGRMDGDLCKGNRKVLWWVNLEGQVIDCLALKGGISMKLRFTRA